LSVPASSSLLLLLMLSVLGHAADVKPATGKSVAQLAELTASDGTADAALGLSVASTSNVVVAGTLTNAVYVFVKPTGGWQNATQTAKLTPSDGKAGDCFGCSVAISGDVIVVGAPEATVHGQKLQGAAYLFIEPAGGWKDMTETAKLIASDGAAGDEFGRSVAVSGPTALIGAPFAAVGANSGQGAAYVFVSQGSPSRSGGGRIRLAMTQAAKLTASDGAAGADFGASVAASGDVIAVGASDGGEAGAGEAYVFVEPPGGWQDGTETAQLKPSDRGGFMGTSVATNGNCVASGAPSRGQNGFQPAIYLFVQPESGWADTTEVAQLGLSGLTNWGFGDAVAIGAKGNFVISGAPYGNGQTQGSGDAFVFLEPSGGWVSTNRPNIRSFPSGGEKNDGFGSSVSLLGQSFGAGSPGAKIGSNQGQGAVYVFGEQQ
jgi:hypothetical protein